MEGGIRTSMPAGATMSSDSRTRPSSSGAGATAVRPSNTRPSRRSMNLQGDVRLRASKKKGKPQFVAATSLAAFAGKAAAVSDLDDEAQRIGELTSDSGFDSVEGLSGEERLQRVTSKPGMTGLLKFTQHGSTKDIRKVGVSPEILQRVVIEDEWQLMSCLQLPTTICFFIMFMLFFQQHYGTSFIHLQESNLRANYADPATEVDDIEGIYGWMTETLLPYAYSTDMSQGVDPFTTDLSGSEYQQWVAGIFIRTQRALIQPCDQEVVKEYDCAYNPYAGGGLGKLDATGKRNQEYNGNYLGGWSKTASRRLQERSESESRRLQESGFSPKESERIQQIADLDGTETPVAESWTEDFFDYRSSFAPKTRMEWLAQKLNSWFPGKRTFHRAGKWIKLPEAKKQPKDKATVKDKKETKEIASPEAEAEEVRKQMASKEFDKWEERARRKNKRSKKMRNMRNKNNKSKKYQKKRTEGLYKPVRRLDDVMVRDKSSSKAPMVYDDSAEPRRLRPTRTEFTLGGWIPYPYVTKDIWQYTIPMSMPFEEVVGLLDTWKDNRIIDRGTLFFGVEILFRNPHISNGLLTHSFINFIFSRGGHIYVEVTMQSLILKTGLGVMAFAFIWICTLVVNSISTPARLCTAWKRGGLPSVKAHMKRFWNFLEWFLIMYGWFIVVAFLAERYGMMKFKDQFDDYIAGRKPLYEKVASDSSSDADKVELNRYDTNWFETIHYNIMNTGNIDVWLQVIVAHYHNFLILRFFVASRGQPRLAIVVNTMRNAAIDLFHLAIVISIIFIAYVVSGHILFGRRLESFATLEGALAYCIQIVLQKEFDFQTLTMQDFWTVTIWVWSFVLLIVLVLVNIVLAMIFDTYAEVRNNVTDSDTLWNTIETIFKQVKLMSVWVSNRDLIMAVKRMQGDQVTSQKLCEQVPGISNVQVQHLFDAAKNKLETLMTKGNKNALPEAVASILIGVDQLKAGVKVMAGDDKMEEILMDDSGEPLESTLADMPADGPLWLREGLVPHLKRQDKFMDQVHKEIQGVDQKIKSRGVGAGLPRSPFEQPGAPWVDGSTVDEPVLKAPTVIAEKRRSNYVAVNPPDSHVTGAGKLGRANPESAPA